MTSRPPTRWMTVALCLGCFLLLVAWDVFVASNGEPGDTISELALTALLEHPLAFMGVYGGLAYTLGHLTWPQYVDGTGRVLWFQRLRRRQ